MKNLNHSKLATNPTWIQRRIREYKQLIKKELELVGCANLNFDLYLNDKSLCFPKNSIRVDFIFNGIKYWASYSVWGNEKYKRYYNDFNDMFVHIDSHKESDKEKYFRIHDIRNELGKKFLNKMTILDCLPLYRKLQAIVES